MAELELSISTASRNFSLALAEEGIALLHYRFLLKPRGKTDLTSMLKDALMQINRKPKDLSRIFVDIGPGGMSTVRTGVAFANALSYSLQIPVIPVLSVELMGLELYQKNKLPILCVINSVRDNAYIAIVKEKVLELRHGSMESTAKEMCASFDEFMIAGDHLEELLTFFPDKKAIKSEVEHTDVDFLISNGKSFLARAKKFPELPQPLNENSLNLLDG